MAIKQSGTVMLNRMDLRHSVDELKMWVVTVEVKIGLLEDHCQAQSKTEQVGR